MNLPNLHQPLLLRGCLAAMDLHHADYPVLDQIALALVNAAGDLPRLKACVAAIMRENIDRVIQTPKTGRRLFSQLQNSEKTYLGTALEIDLRSSLGLQRGKAMDLEISGHDVDVKFSQTEAWMIPRECVGRPCILLSGRETQSKFSLRLIVAREDYLTQGKNQDKKRRFTAHAIRENALPLILNADYPRNFWLDVQDHVAVAISDGRSGNDRLIRLFKEVPDRIITRKIIQDVAAQLDFTRRLRADKSRGTKNRLRRDSIGVLSGSNPRHRALAETLGVPVPGPTEYLAHNFLDPKEAELARRHGLEL